MPKNIVILSDGTGQKGGKGFNTNVYRLFNMLEDRTADQIVFYDPGIGTGRNGLLNAIVGGGFSNNIMDCYKFLFENYQSDDRVFLFGFSRGAATVRSLSGFIHMFGILPASRPDLIEEAYGIYKVKNTERRAKLAKKFLDRHHTMWLKIRFVGVWDTVAALGIQNKFLDAIANVIAPHHFHSFTLSNCVEYARHALAIDDERKTFHPVIWEKIPNDNPQDPRLKQVWFCGVHTDVGGGYAEPELSNFSLRWMIREATAKGLRMYEKGEPWKQFQDAVYDIEGRMHDELLGFKGRLFRREVRSWNPEKYGTICIHESVPLRKKNSANGTDPSYAPWILKYEDRTVES